jgi:hypothetical protein
VDPGSIVFYVDGEEYRPAYSAETGIAVVTVRLEDGPHTLRVEAADAAGNRASASAEFTVDSTPPRISVEEPSSEVVPSSEVRVRVVVEDSVGLDRAEVALNGEVLAACECPARPSGSTRTPSPSKTGSTS